MHSRGANARQAVVWWNDMYRVGEESLIIALIDNHASNGSHHKLLKKIRIRNNLNEDTVYTITPTFWNATISNNSSIVTVSPVFPGKIIKVNGEMERSVSISIEIRDKLSPSDMKKSLDSQDAKSPEELTPSLSDYDGYLKINDGKEEPIHLPWHFVSRKD